MLIFSLHVSLRRQTSYFFLVFLFIQKCVTMQFMIQQLFKKQTNKKTAPEVLHNKQHSTLDRPAVQPQLLPHLWSYANRYASKAHSATNPRLKLFLDSFLTFQLCFTACGISALKNDIVLERHLRTSTKDIQWCLDTSKSPCHLRLHSPGWRMKDCICLPCTGQTASGDTTTITTPVRNKGQQRLTFLVLLTWN